MYRLTIPEIRDLRAGFRVERQLQRDAQNGVDASDRERLAEFDEWREEQAEAPPS